GDHRVGIIDARAATGRQHRGVPARDLDELHRALDLGIHRHHVQLMLRVGRPNSAANGKFQSGWRNLASASSSVTASSATNWPSPSRTTTGLTSKYWASSLSKQANSFPAKSATFLVRSVEKPASFVSFSSASGDG